MYQWIIDSELIPHIVVDTTIGEVEVPQEYVNEDGKIVLNIGPKAANDFAIDADELTFTCRFDGVFHEVSVACGSVIGIYAKETGKGMIFTPIESEQVEEENTQPHLRLVVDNDRKD
jgi:stringent starvation protein B